MCGKTYPHPLTPTVIIFITTFLFFHATHGHNVQLVERGSLEEEEEEDDCELKGCGGELCFHPFQPASG